MIPIKQVHSLVKKYELLEQELASGTLQKKEIAKKSDLISEAQKFFK